MSSSTASIDRFSSAVAVSPAPGPSRSPRRTPSDQRPPPAACSAGTGPRRTPDTGPPAARPGGNGPGQALTSNAQDTGSHSSQLPSQLGEQPGKGGQGPADVALPIGGL